jgi:hypothetical protein
MRARPDQTLTVLCGHTHSPGESHPLPNIRDTIWLTQALIAELFEIGVGTVNHHLKEIYAEAELAPGATIRRYRMVRTEGNRSVSLDIKHYSLPLQKARKGKA